MYFWKCWRDTRTSFFIYLAAFTLLALWVSFFPVLHFKPAQGWSIQFPQTPSEAQTAWKISTAVLAPAALMVGMLAGIGLGATGVGAEFTPGTLEFLLTRPRRRRFFVWRGWAVGVMEVCVLAAFYIALSAIGTALVTGRASPRMLIVFPVAVTGALVALGVSYFLTVAGREAKYGAMIGLLLLFGYPAFVAIMRQYAGINLPTPWSLVPGGGPDPSGGLYATIPFPYASMAGWLAFALVLPYLAQLLFDRAEV